MISQGLALNFKPYDLTDAWLKRKKNHMEDYNASPKLLCCSPRLKPITHVCLTCPFPASAKHFLYTILFTVFNFSFTNGEKVVKIARHRPKRLFHQREKQMGAGRLEHFGFHLNMCPVQLVPCLPH